MAATTTLPGFDLERWAAILKRDRAAALWLLNVGTRAGILARIESAGVTTWAVVRPSGDAGADPHPSGWGAIA